MLNKVNEDQINDLYEYLLSISKKEEYSDIKEYFLEMEGKITSPRYWCINIFNNYPVLYIEALKHISDKYYTYPDFTNQILEHWTYTKMGRVSNTSYIGEIITLNIFEGDVDFLSNLRKMLVSILSTYKKNEDEEQAVNLLKNRIIYKFLSKKHYRKINNLKEQFPKLNFILSQHKILEF